MGLSLLLPAFLLDLDNSPYSEYIVTFGLFQFQIAAGMLLMAMLAFQIPTNVFTRAIALIGLHSYSIYLWNFPFRWFFGTNNVLYFSGNIIWGILLGLGFETPILKIRDTFFPSRIVPKADVLPAPDLAVLK